MGRLVRKDRVRRAIISSEANAACKREAMSRRSPDAADNNPTLIGRGQVLESVLVAPAPQFANVLGGR